MQQSRYTAEKERSVLSWIAKEKGKREKLKLELSPHGRQVTAISESILAAARTRRPSDAPSTKVWGLKQATAIWPIESP